MNLWKPSFYILLGINIAVILILMILILSPTPDSKASDKEVKEPKESSEFIVRTTRSNLNDLVNAYLTQTLKDTEHQFKVVVDEDVHLTGKLPLFSSTVPLSVHLEPIVQENGDVILKQKSISVGLLELPNQKVMEYIEKYLPMPEWVAVNPKKEEIYVAITDMKMKSNFQVSAERIDLAADNIAFKIKIPYETLGLDSDQ